AAVLAGASTVAIALLAWGVPGPVAVAAAFVIGLSAGSDGDLLSYLVSRYFGMRAFGTLSSLVFSAYLVGTSLFPWLTGVLAERTGSYAAPMVLCATLGVGTVVAMMVLGQCCKPALVASN
ncbi:MAG TPA: hypothetical protein VHB68_12145, partial [Steroidobacteraceae bacterium]|nr:hypothetical protein [Steroidobacteraceae bacterium]